MRVFSAVLAAFVLTACTASAPERVPDAAPHADEGPGVYIVNLHDGDVVSSPLRVVFGLYGMGVAPAGTEKQGTGHHHLLIDAVLEGDELKYPVPSTDNHIHFGAGQTETVLELPAGEHTLQLLFADMNHVPFDPPIMSETITITVR